MKELLTGMGMGLEELQEEEDKGLEEGEEGGEGLPMDLDEGGAAPGPAMPGRRREGRGRAPLGGEGRGRTLPSPGSAQWMNCRIWK